MDIKKKLQSLVKPKTQGGSSTRADHQEITQNSFTDEAAISKFKEHIQESHHDPRIDIENINSIEEQYFGEDGFDPSQFELQRFTPTSTLEEISETRTKLRKQLQSVSKRVSELILGNHQAYAAELERVMELQDSLQTALIICSASRRSLSQSEKTFSVASLHMLANHRKRQQLQGLMRSLKTIKTLQRTDVRLREMLEKEDYPGAIELCLVCQQVSSTFRHYTCISELSSKLQDTLEMIEERLDNALAKTCNNFDENHYSKVQTAYQLLGKTQTSMDQLHMHFTSAIHNVAFTIVLGYVELCSGGSDGSNQKRQYSDLCKWISHQEFITYESFTPCLKDLCKALWGILLNYHKIKEWHNKQTFNPSSQDAADESSEDRFNRQYVEQKLEHGRVRLWQDLQLKIKAFLLAVNLSSFKFNEFTYILNLVSKLKSVGEEFSGTKSELLEEGIHEQTLRYFHQYHASRMEEVRMFLENEGWELCPVRYSFTILQLQEFSFMRTVNTSSLYKKSSDTSVMEAVPSRGYFDQESSPFEDQPDEEIAEDFMALNGDALSDSDEEISAELRQDFIDDGTDYSSRQKDKLHRNKSVNGSGKAAPILTNSSLTVLRQFGKYMRMTNLLEPIAYEVITSMSQLFDYYLYTVYTRFAAQHMEDDRVEGRPCVSPKLQTTLQRVTVEIGALPSHPSLGTAETLFGLTERIVAIESLIYLAKQFEFLQSHLEKIIPASKKAFLQQFHSHTISTISELRCPIYRAVTDHILNQDQIVTLISQVKWDIKDIMSEHNSYVDIILRELQVFSSKLSDVSRRVHISTEVHQVLWQQCSKSAALLFVEGYSMVKKCTNEGRALMQLDFQQFLMKLGAISEIRALPGREYVEKYIKAYYLPEQDMETWAKEHKEYTPRQISSVISCVPHLKKSVKDRIKAQIDDKFIKKEMSSPFSHIQNLGKKL